VGGNICFYPHEEIVRFVNKYVRKREGISDFRDIMPNLDANTASLDLGCGIGRHVKLLDEFGLNPYGIDLSDTAIGMGKQWFDSIGRSDLSDKLQVASVTELPFENEYFNICVSHGVLDSMPRELAMAGIKETYRVLRHGGLMYFDLIMDSKRGDVDEKVKSGYEKDTVQSYFTIESIKAFVGIEAEIIEFKIISWKDEKGKEYHRRAHLIIRKR
jgi:SAM-dependent methyltransferase